MGMVAAHADGDAVRHKLNQSVFHAAPHKFLGLPYTYWVWDLQNVKIALNRRRWLRADQ